jgi:putative MATE family efflux protein
MSHPIKDDLTSGSIPRHLVRMTVPMIWSILAIVSFQLVNTYYISLLGTKELAAVSMTFPITYGIFGLTMGFGIAVSSITARLIGQGDTDSMRRIVTHGLIIVALFSSIVGFISLGLLHPIFHAMGADDESLKLIKSYMTIWLLGSAALSMPIVANSAMRATGDPRTPALIMVGSAIANVLIDPVMIFGLFGFPKLGMTGAAISSVISSAGASAIVLYILYAKKNMLCHGGLQWDKFGDSAKRILTIALPVGVAGLMQPLTAALITEMLTKHGHEAVAAFGVATRMEAFAFVIIMALAVGMSPILGQNHGAKKTERVQETLRKALLFAALWSFVIGVFFIAFAHPLGSLFSTDPEFLKTLALYFSIVALTYIPGNVLQGWSSAFNALGMPKQSFMMTIVRMIVLTIPCTMIGNHLMGVTGIFCGLALANILSGVGFHLLNRRTLNRVDPVP